MYESNYPFKKKKGNGKLAVFLAILAILICIALITGLIVYFLKDDIKAEETNTRQKDEIPIEEDSGTTELIGYGKLIFSKESPNLSLSNLETNETLLVYEVKNEEEEILYETGFLMPGDEEEFNIAEELEPGEHVLIYSISIYNDSFECLNSEIEMLQKIEILGVSE